VAARGRSGFSLLELLVALAFAGILLGGMVRVCLASLDSWSRVNQDLAAQRALRWALDRMAEDLRLAGHRFPPPEGPAAAAGAGPGRQGAVTLLPDQPVRTVGNPCPPGPGGELRTADELGLVLDLPVRVRVVLAQACGADPSPGAALTPVPAVRVRAAQALRLRPGDLLLAPGARFGIAAVARATRLPAGQATTVPLAVGGGAPGFTARHPAGTPVQVVRPLRVVRYAVVGLPPDPDPGSAGAVPCLVRFEADCPGDGTAPRWDRMLSGRPGRGWEVLARHVAAFRVDFAPDAPPGFRDAAARVQVRLELRCPNLRDRPPRGQTLVVAPRNFGLAAR
jgi:prepilin-type N-terminal cleavage/methylation domain-containing protein